jgi:regulator of sigma D
VACFKEDEEDSMRTDNKIADLATDNMKAKKELINKLSSNTSNSNKELLYKWLQIENTFL